MPSPLDLVASRKLDDAIDDFAEDSFAFLERLVGARRRGGVHRGWPSTRPGSARPASAPRATSSTRSIRSSRRSLRLMPTRTGRHRGASHSAAPRTRLAQAVIDGHPVRAAELAADHFSLTESMLRELHARVMPRSGQPQDGQPQE